MIATLARLLHRLTCRSCVRVGGTTYHLVSKPKRIPWDRFVRREM